MDTGYDAFSVGLEGFYDRYHENRYSEPFVTMQGGLGSLTGNYTNHFDKTYFGAIDFRASYGEASYNSASGTGDSIPQWEYELRLRGGVDLPVAGGVLSPYAGIGGRYYVMDGKDVLIDGHPFYDRRIAQLYVPLGVTFTTPILDGSYYMAPTLEFDPMLIGSVNSRLQNQNAFYTPNPIYANVYNVQHSGWGVRGEWMVGQKASGPNLGWEAGPFVRYWNIKDSNLSYASTPYYANRYYEPDNSRLQIGVALRMSW